MIVAKVPNVIFVTAFGWLLDGQARRGPVRKLWHPFCFTSLLSIHNPLACATVLFAIKTLLWFHFFKIEYYHNQLYVMFCLVLVSFTLVVYASPLSADALTPRRIDGRQDSTGDSTCGFTGKLGYVWTRNSNWRLLPSSRRDCSKRILSRLGRWYQVGEQLFQMGFVYCTMLYNEHEQRVLSGRSSNFVLLGIVSMLYNFDRHCDYNHTLVKKLIQLVVCQLTATGFFIYSIW